MKKGLMVLTMALFTATIGLTSYTVAQEGVQTEIEKDGDKEKKCKRKKCNMKDCKKECGTKETEAKTCANKEGEGKACCAKKR